MLTPAQKTRRRRTVGCTSTADRTPNVGKLTPTINWLTTGVFGIGDVVRVTPPSRQEREASGDAPGDGSPLSGVHPDFTLMNPQPNGSQPQVTGFDALPDGRKP